ncbi:hypothetical protein ILYODFUR_012136 [Ilyodon furcidens]|uniref:Secreted protein n=1 Tax=Ilyodon furcidens TaxID=33524 RepID=A0ABV0USR5_9TELE
MEQLTKKLFPLNVCANFVFLSIEITLAQCLSVYLFPDCATDIATVNYISSLSFFFFFIERTSSSVFLCFAFAMSVSFQSSGQRRKPLMLSRVLLKVSCY